jgi:hypothetical protein
MLAVRRVDNEHAPFHRGAVVRDERAGHDGLRRRASCPTENPYARRSGLGGSAVRLACRGRG